MKLTEEQQFNLAQIIEEKLKSVRLTHFRDDEGGQYPLVDLLSQNSEDNSITQGIVEIGNIVDQLYEDMESWDI